MVEKADLLVSMHEWEQGMEVLGQVLQQEPDNIQALHFSGEHLVLLLVIVLMRQVTTNWYEDDTHLAFQHSALLHQ